MTETTAPARIVVDITGGAIHAVYAGQPVEVVFISHDADDIEQDAPGYRSPDDKPVALWKAYSDVEHADSDAEVVDHYFGQYDEAN